MARSVALHAAGRRRSAEWSLIRNHSARGGVALTVALTLTPALPGLAAVPHRAQCPFEEEAA